MSSKENAQRGLGEFLDDLLHRWKLSYPDGRVLHAYECTEMEFRELVDRLRNYAPQLPSRETPAYQHASADFSEFDACHPPTKPNPQFESAVRAFALYASEFWRLYLDEAWCRRVLRMEKYRPIRWLTFLSYVGWDEVYLPPSGQKRTRRDRAANEGRLPSEVWESEYDLERVLSVKPREPLYPALYEPLQQAWAWWQVVPLHLPTSIRYLDTFAVQGGAQQALTVELERGPVRGEKVVYFAVKPPGGYGTDVISLNRSAVDRDGGLPKTINATFVLGRASDDV